MVLLPPAALNQAFITALGTTVVGVVDAMASPLELQLAAPFPDQVRAYLYNATNPSGGRSTPEHKIQLIAPGQVRGGARGNFDFSGAAKVLLAGKVEDEEAWVLWDATMHLDFSFSKNVQVKTTTIDTALDTSALAFQLRRLPQRGQETVIATPTALLGTAIRQRLAGGQAVPTTVVPPLRTGGRAYVTPTRSESSGDDRSQVFARDPDKIDRGTNAHMDTQDRLAETLRAHGLDPLSPDVDDPDFDVAWKDADIAYPTEVKSLTTDNEEKQLRLGLGQVLRYGQRLAWDVSEVRPVLAVERKPTDDSWTDLCRQLGVILTWPERFEQDLFGGE